MKYISFYLPENITPRLGGMILRIIVSIFVHEQPENHEIADCGHDKYHSEKHHGKPSDHNSIYGRHESKKDCRRNRTGQVMFYFQRLLAMAIGSGIFPQHTEPNGTKPSSCKDCPCCAMNQFVQDNPTDKESECESDVNRNLDRRKPRIEISGQWISVKQEKQADENRKHRQHQQEPRITRFLYADDFHLLAIFFFVKILHMSSIKKKQPMKPPAAFIMLFNN